MQDNELITGLKAGNERAFEQLVMQYQGRIYNTVLGFVQNESEAEDLTQEVFIKLFQGIGEFRGGSKLSTWVYRVAVNHALDGLKKLRKQNQQGFLKMFFGKQMDVGLQDFHHPGVALEKKEEAAILFRLIRGLPEKQQAALVLQKLEGLSQQEIAEVMRTTVSAVESLLVRAKANLKQRYEAGF